MELLKCVTPNKLDKFVANKIQIKHLNDFINNHSSSNNIICVIGTDGCGKTTLCNLVFNKHNKQVLEIGKDSLLGSDIKQVLQNFANNMTIDTILFKKEKIVFVDDIDILMNIDKLIFSKILSVDKFLKAKNIKIVMTANINDEKKLSDHAKDIDIIKIVNPFYKDSYAYIMNCFNDNDIVHDPSVLLNITQKCRGNICETVLNLQTSTKDLEEKKTQEAFKDLNNFEITRKILQRNYSSEDLSYFQKCDIGIIPYMLYENLPDELETNYKFKKGKTSLSLLDYYRKVNTGFIEASLFEDKAYKSLDWQFLSYSNMLKMNSIDNVLNSLEKKACMKDVKYRFSQMLSKTSHKNILAKKVKGVSGNMNISNMMIVNAVDIQAQKKEVDDTTNKKTKKKDKQKGNKMSTDETSIVSTYEKNFK
jgi:ABC-type dipeptide/oligopeptide/nickel transport system ATPase subunit